MEQPRTRSTERLRRLPLHERYVALGVAMVERDGWLLPRNFQSHETDILLLRHENAFVDISDWGVVKATGTEVVEWIHRITTNDFRQFAGGGVRQTLLLTEKGRVIDSLLVFRRGDVVWVLTSRGANRKVAEWLEKYIIMEDIRISDETGAHTLFLRLPAAEIAESTTPGVMEQRECGGSFFGMNAEIGFDSEGDYPDSLRVGIVAFESFRIARGIPAFGKEMTEEFNPLELGLRGQVSFQKGCYVGQEIIARLDTYDKVQRELCRVRVNDAIVLPERALLMKGGEKVGVLTSHGVNEAASSFSDGLAVIRKSEATEGNEFTVEGTERTVTIEQLFGHRG